MEQDIMREKGTAQREAEKILESQRDITEGKTLALHETSPWFDP